MPDLDDQRFVNGLNQTKAGLRLRLAFYESSIAVEQVRCYLRLSGPQHRRSVDSWRRAYIRACERASRCIDELWEEHQWPADAARARDFTFTPSLRRRAPRPYP